MSDRTDVRHAAVRWRRIMLLLMTLTAAVAGNSAAARPLQYQIHGFAAQAYAHSDGNNYVGSSLDGSFEFFELGLNGSVAYGPLTVSAQGLVRKFGEIDDGQPRLDYGFADYRLFSTMNYNAGIRAGRVKNYYGLYNDSRDVVFTRPGVLLPGSVYFESTGIRALLFSSDGGQVYGGFNSGDHYFSLVATRGLDTDASQRQKKILFGSTEPVPNDVRINGFFIMRLMDEWGAGAWRAALTYTTTGIEADPAPTNPVSGTIDATVWIGSLAYNAERYSITSEYVLTSTTTRTNLTGRSFGRSDGGYVQGDYRFNERWTGMLRYDLYWPDRNDRSGDDYAAATGGDRHRRYARDLTAGVKWLPDRHWGVWGEYHVIRGSATVPRLENGGRMIEADGNLFLLMVGYHF